MIEVDRASRLGYGRLADDSSEMMRVATRNLFRFVSVRPPDDAPVDDACRLINTEAGASFVDAVRARRRDYEEPLQTACRSVSVAFMESAEYFARSDIWKDLRPLRSQFMDFIERLCSRRHEGEARRPVESALDGPDSFAVAKHNLWCSYYANVLAPELRPNDRPEMLDWIRVMAAFERLRPGPEEREWRHDAVRCACVERLGRARVNMPHELFAETPPPDREPDEPEDASEEEILALRESLARLHAARRDLDQLYRRKVSRLRLTPPERERDQGLGRAARNRAEDGPRRGVGSEPARPMQPLWLLTEEDAEILPHVTAELERLGVPLAGSIVSEAADALDEAITVRTSALTALESRVDILGVGLTMALARRTVRGLRLPPRPDAAHEEDRNA